MCGLVSASSTGVVGKGVETFAPLSDYDVTMSSINPTVVSLGGDKAVVLWGTYYRPTRNSISDYKVYVTVLNKAGGSFSRGPHFLLRRPDSRCTILWQPR